jgi:hypothetical protein
MNWDASTMNPDALTMWQDAATMDWGPKGKIGLMTILGLILVK